MNPGRSPFMQTGNGIPSALLQTNAGTGEDLKAKATREAEAKRAADKSNLKLGETKNFTATVSNITPAKTPAEIEAWKASLGKPGAGRFNKTATATVSKEGTNNITPKGVVNFSNEIKASEMPKSETMPKAKAQSYNNYWHKSNTNTKSGFGGGSSWGVTTAESYIGGAGKRKQAADTNPDVIKGGAPFATGEDNEFSYQQMTDQEQKLWNNHRLTQDSNPFGKDPVKRQAWLNEVEAKLDTDLKNKSDRKAAVDTKKAAERTTIEARQKEKADKLAASKAQVAAAKAAKIEAIKAKQKKKAPTQMRKR